MTLPQGIEDHNSLRLAPHPRWQRRVIALLRRLLRFSKRGEDYAPVGERLPDFSTWSYDPQTGWQEVVHTDVRWVWNGPYLSATSLYVLRRPLGPSERNT